MQGTLESTDLHRWINVFGYPWKSMGVSYVIEPSDGVVCNSIADVKSKAVGTTVFLSTPVALSCATNAFKDYTFFVQSDDRSIGMKCIGSADLPAYTADNKITFTGVIEAGPAGQPNVVRIQSINSAVTATAPNPLGVVGKNLSVTNAPLNRLIRVWGTLKSRNPTDIGPGPFDASTTTWPWNYWTISDGSQDIKVLMNVQSGWMCPPYIPDSPTWNIGVTYIGITGIATLDGTGQLVVMPLRDASIVSYTE
jgi:hypothetical protein